MTGQAAVRLFQIDVQPGVGAIEGWRHLTGTESYRLSDCLRFGWGSACCSQRRRPLQPRLLGFYAAIKHPRTELVV
jgi:hypothetical protein